MNFKKKTFLIAGFWLFVGLLTFHPALAGDLDSVKNLLKTANQQAKGMKVQTTKNTEAQQAAKIIGKTFNSPAYQNMLHNEIVKIRTQLSPGAASKPQISTGPRGKILTCFPTSGFMYLFRRRSR